MSDAAPTEPATCTYYQGCDEPRKSCGYCTTHCLCGVSEDSAAQHPFDADPEASLPGVYCRCGYDVDVHVDKGNATVRNGRYVLPERPSHAK